MTSFIGLQVGVRKGVQVERLRQNSGKKRKLKINKAFSLQDCSIQVISRRAAAEENNGRKQYFSPREVKGNSITAGRSSNR